MPTLEAIKTKYADELLPPPPPPVDSARGKPPAITTSGIKQGQPGPRKFKAPISTDDLRNTGVPSQPGTAEFAIENAESARVRAAEYQKSQEGNPASRIAKAVMNTGGDNWQSWTTVETNVHRQLRETILPITGEDGFLSQGFKVAGNDVVSGSAVLGVKAIKALSTVWVSGLAAVHQTAMEMGLKKEHANELIRQIDAATIAVAPHAPFGNPIYSAAGQVRVTRAAIKKVADATGDENLKDPMVQAKLEEAMLSGTEIGNKALDNPEPLAKVTKERIAGPPGVLTKGHVTGPHATVGKERVTGPRGTIVDVPPLAAGKPKVTPKPVPKAADASAEAADDAAEAAKGPGKSISDANARRDAGANTRYSASADDISILGLAFGEPGAALGMVAAAAGSGGKAGKAAKAAVKGPIKTDFPPTTTIEAMVDSDPISARDVLTGLARKTRATEPDVDQLVSIVEDLAKANGLVRDPSVPITVQAIEIIKDAAINGKQLEEFLLARGMTRESFDKALKKSMLLFQTSATVAGRTLAHLSRLDRKLNEGLQPHQQRTFDDFLNLLFDSPDQLAAAQLNANNWWNRVKDAPHKFANIWRGLLTTQLATAVRNVETQGARIGLDSMTRALDHGMIKLFGNKNALNPGVPASHTIDVFGDFLRMYEQVRHPKSSVVREQVDELVAMTNTAVHAGHRRDVVDLEAKLYLNWASDMQRLRQKKGLYSAAERSVEMLNIVNRTQEYITRRAVFIGELHRGLTRIGLDLDDVITNGDILAIPRPIMEDAVKGALRVTFSEDFPMKSIPGTIIQTINRIPGLPFLIPFPRFMMNSLKFQFEYSPLGAFRLMTPDGKAKLANGDYSQLSQAIIGLALWTTAWQMANSEFATEEWYKFKVGDKAIDIRPMNPFASYMFIAHVGKKLRDGRIGDMKTGDFTKALAGLQLGGSTSFILDEALRAMQDVTDKEQVLAALANIQGDIRAGFLTPIRTVLDFASAFDKEQAFVRDTSLDPGSQTNALVPGMREKLPIAHSPTSSEPIRREYGLVRQLTGQTITRLPNAAETELSRLGFRQTDIHHKTGVPDYDYIMGAFLGPAVEKHLGNLVQRDNYKAAGDLQKQLLIRKGLQMIRQQSARKLQDEYPGLHERMKFLNQPRIQRKLLQEEMKKRGIKSPELYKGMVVPSQEELAQTRTNV